MVMLSLFVRTNGKPAKWRAIWEESGSHNFSYYSMDFIAKKENPDAKTEGEETIVIRVCDSVRGKWVLK